jgi:broad specificity phosphatase PhoE
VEREAMSEVLYLIRHATPDWNRKDIPYFLPPGPPLSETGLEEAEMLADFFQFTDLKCIYSSPLERCLRTANAIAQKTNCPLIIEPGLSEHRPEESRAEVQTRLMPVFAQAIHQARENPVALVTHGSPIEILLDRMGLSRAELNSLKTRFDHRNPVPPAGVWEAVRSGDEWNLSLVLDPQNARTEKLYGRI